jgi:hypothetical protein
MFSGMCSRMVLYRYINISDKLSLNISVVLPLTCPMQNLATVLAWIRHLIFNHRTQGGIHAT